jgi:predicted ABC-type ATPase
MSDKKEVYIVGGPNGAGKTTFVKQFLPNYVNVRNFVNADDIAGGLSPLDSSSMPITSGKLMLKMIDKYMKKGEPFGFESTLAGQKWMRMIQGLKKAEYQVYIFFLDLPSADLAVSRVKYRVETGGHGIPEDTIRRRYLRSRRNFWYNYRKEVDGWYLFDNSTKTPKLIANNIDREMKVIDVKYMDFFEASLGER